VDTSGERKENHLTDVTSEEETKVENHRGLTVDTSGERKESNSSPVESNGSSNSSPVESNGSSNSSPVESNSSSNSSPVESNSSPVESKSDNSYPCFTPTDSPMDRVLDGKSLTKDDLYSLTGGGLKETRNPLPALSEREQAFVDCTIGDESLSSLDGNSLNILKHPPESCLKNLHLELGLVSYYQDVDFLTIRYQFLQHSINDYMVSRQLGIFPTNSPADHQLKWLLSLDSKMIEHGWLSTNGHESEFFEKWLEKTMTFFVKRHPMNPFEDAQIHEGVNICFEEKYSQESYSGTSLYKMFNQRWETTCNEKFNDVLTKKRFAVDFLNAMLKE